MEVSVRRREYIDLILNNISDSFDIYHNYWFKDRKFVVYAYNYDKKNKFDTAKNAKLWDSKSYEHLFFINCDDLNLEKFKELYQFIIDSIEPHFVRADKRWPQKNHMCSYISFIIITKNPITYEVSQLIKKSNFKKNYLFGARGFSNVRIAVITPSSKEVTVNKYGAKIGNFLTELLPNE